MKRTWKQIGSLILSVCMVFTMLPTMAFAETGVTDSGAPLGISGEITAFAALNADVAAQTKEIGTAEDALKLPDTLAVTVAENGDETATGSDARKETSETTVAVERWISDPAYDGDTAGDYVFIPTLDLPDGLTLAEDVSAPTITVTVREEIAAPQAKGIVGPLGVGTITGSMDIGGETGKSLASDQSGTGWAWNAASATLTLNSNYGGSFIKFECADTDTINLVCEGDVTVNKGTTYAIQSFGSLVIKGSGPLTLSGGLQAFKDIVILGKMGNISVSDSFGICAGGSIQIIGTVGDITGSNAIFADGDITISNDAVVGKIGAGGTGPSSSGYGIYSQNGGVTINGKTGDVSGRSCGIHANGGNVFINGTTGDISSAKGSFPDDSAIRAKISVAINGTTGAISSKGDYGIYAESDKVLIAGKTGDITGTKVNGINAAAVGVTISPDAVVGNIAGAQNGIYADGSVTIGGKTGNITGIAGKLGGGIRAIGSVTITGETGDITGTHPSNPAIDAGGDVTIVGSVGKIAVLSSASGGGCGIYAVGGINIINSVTVSSDVYSALNKALATLPSSYTATWSDNADGSDPSTGSTYTWNASHKYVKIEKISGVKLATPTSLTWDTTTPGKAKWTAVADAFTYTVILYKDGTFKTASPPTITATEYDFTSFITEPGAYTFTVTALAVAPNKSSDESAASPVYNYTVAPVFFDDTSVPTFFLPALPTSDTSGGSGGTAWTWNNTAKNLTLQGASAFILKGRASGEMRVLSPDTPVSLVLDGAAFESPAGYDALYLTKGGTVAVLANSHVTGGINTDKLDIVLNDASLTVDKNLGYTQSITASDLTLSGIGTVEARSANGVAVFCAGDLTVGSGCTLNASGANGIQFQGARTIRGGGRILANGENYFGIGENGAGKALTFDFAGNLEIRGKTYGILMGMNDSADKATVTFASKPASLLISSGKGIIGSINYEGTPDVGTVTLDNTANIPGLSEVFDAGGKEFPATSGTLLTITLNANGGTVSPATMQTDTAGTLTSLPTPTRSGSYRFDGWFTASSGGTRVTISTVFTANTTIYAHWTDTSGGSGGSGGGGYIPPTVTTPIVTEKQPDMSTVAKPTVSGTVKDGVLSAAITEQMAKDAIKATQDVAKKSGKELDGIALDFNVTGSGNYSNLNAIIEAGAIDRLKEAGVKFIKIGSTVLDITFDTDAITEIDKQSAGTVKISAKKITKLSKAAIKLIGSRPVFDITVSYQKNGKTEYVGNFGKGSVTLAIAYRATGKERKGNLFAVYVDKNGKPQLLTNSSYDNSGRLIFSRNTLSSYGVGYKAPIPAFTDTEKHWAKDNIDFVASRDLIRGMSVTTFAPNKAITRATFLMALGKFADSDVSGYKTSSFTDVKNTDPAMPYIEWAVKSKIVSGYGNGKFGPSDSITREQMAVMMVGYAKATGYKLPVSKQAITFADDVKISAYAKDAVKAIQQTGVVGGKDNNRFDPQGNATRAEASTILRRFVELVIDEGTARGWVQNDAGQWQWIGENGKPVVGWLTAENGKYHYYFTADGIMVSGKWLQIDVKWYYFYTDGSLAKSTKVDGYEVDENGVRKMK